VVCGRGTGCVCAARPGRGELRDAGGVLAASLVVGVVGARSRPFLARACTSGPGAQSRRVLRLDPSWGGRPIHARILRARRRWFACGARAVFVRPVRAAGSCAMPAASCRLVGDMRASAGVRARPARPCKHARRCRGVRRTSRESECAANAATERSRWLRRTPLRSAQDSYGERRAERAYAPAPPRRVKPGAGVQERVCGERRYGALKMAAANAATERSEQ
jgi:hypothetical protein